MSLFSLALCACEDDSPEPALIADAATQADAAQTPDAEPDAQVVDAQLPDAAELADAGGEADAEIADAAPLDDAEVDAELVEADAGADTGVDVDLGPMPDAEVDAAPEVDAAVPIENCVGPDPQLAMPFPPRGAEDCATCPGSPAPEWALRDVQPQSCGVGQTYGLDAFIGQTTLFALFNAGCGTCQAQSTKLEQMRFEFQLEGRAVHIVALNSASNADRIDRLIERCAFPLLQDTAEANVWRQHVEEGGVSDFFIYGRDGRLVQYIDYSAHDPSVRLNTDEGYQNLKQAIIDADDQ